PLSPTRRQFTVMVETARGTGSYSAELSKTRELKTRLADAHQTTAPWVCDASLYRAERAADAGVLLVGDAASFIEPLSSAGVKKALTSAWRAAVVTNTCLSKPSMAAAALDLYNRREVEIFDECRRRSTQFFQEAAAVYGGAFWRARAESMTASDSRRAPP